MPEVHRVVIGANGDKKSAVVFRDSTNHQETPNIFWRSTLWATTELPVNNQMMGDRAADVTDREPTENGLTFRALEIPPDIKDAEKHIAILEDLNKKVKQNYPPTFKDLERHPSMHRTDTCDMFTVAYGEIYIVTDTDETLFEAGRYCRGSGRKPCLGESFGQALHDYRSDGPRESVAAKCLPGIWSVVPI